MPELAASSVGKSVDANAHHEISFSNRLRLEGPELLYALFMVDEVLLRDVAIDRERAALLRHCMRRTEIERELTLDGDGFELDRGTLDHTSRFSGIAIHSQMMSWRQLHDAFARRNGVCGAGSDESAV